ncbi:MAG: hypothetical protein ACHQSE_16080 [Gemmatimonadales bacterium]
MQPREGAAVRVVVSGATSSSGNGTVAAVFARAVREAGLGIDRVEVVDAGATLDGMRTASTAGAARYVVVAAPNNAALAAAFAMVKAIETRHPGARIEVLVTGQDESRAHAAYLRVRAAAERFLRRDVGFAGAFTDLDAAPEDESLSDSSTRRATRADRTARMWAARLLAECSEDAWHDAAHSMN